MLNDLTIELHEAGNEVTIATELKNFGPEPILIENIVTSCNCVSARSESNVVPSFGKTVILLRIRTNSARGWKTASIACQTNAALNSLAKCNIRLNLQPKVRILRGNGYFGTIGAEETPVCREIYLDFDEKTAVGNIVNGQSVFTLLLRKDEENEGLWLLTVSLSGNRIGKFTDEAVLYDNEGSRLLTIPLLANITSP